VLSRPPINLEKIAMRNLATTALVFAVACASQPTKDAEDGLEGPGGKADGKSLPIGTYVNSSPKVGQFVSLTLETDHTFTRTVDGLCPGGGTCAPQSQSGLFLYTLSGTKSYLHFYGEDGESIDRAAWTLDGSTLTLTPDGIDPPYTMVQSGPCEAAGGVCLPDVPEGCPNGHFGDPAQYTCGDLPSGFGCCLPTTDNSCQVASDCHGILPNFEKVCSNGQLDGAHWACIDDQCQITSCQ
jgi:hypothetical protein